MKVFLSQNVLKLSGKETGFHPTELYVHTKLRKVNRKAKDCAAK
jgi:hypothetical protein